MILSRGTLSVNGLTQQGGYNMTGLIDNDGDLGIRILE